jgi:choline dehydrogenase
MQETATTSTANASKSGRGSPQRSSKSEAKHEDELKYDYDFIVVGSGAGGGPVAANLALHGFSVALLEAGGLDEPATYRVPAFSARASEDPDLSWDFVVRHYKDNNQQQRDSKNVGKHRARELARKFKDPFGIWYPRAGTLGGCTSHHALVTIRPHRSDWEHIADVTQDDSWRASKMQQYFEKLERCQYRRGKEGDRSGHGFKGWLPTTIATPLKFLTADWKVFRIVSATLLSIAEGNLWSNVRYFWRAWRIFSGGPKDFLLGSYFDPNDLRTPSFEREGMFFMPFTTEVGRRANVRDLFRLAQDHTDKLTIRTHTLVTRILFDNGKGNLEALDITRLSDKQVKDWRDRRVLKAIGVQYLEGPHHYQSDPRTDCEESSCEDLDFKELRAREVILAGGAFNSPQLLMLSGIGTPVDEDKRDEDKPDVQGSRQDEEKRFHGIPLLKDLPVGGNLQDRYEVGVVCKTKTPFRLTRGATFHEPELGKEPDPLFKQWLEGKGPYATNGGIIFFTRKPKSSAADAQPDLFMFCLPGDFRGYFPGYSDEAYGERNVFSWLILKAHTHNRGTVSLRSRDPRESPKISFNYFDPGEGTEEDLNAVVDGIEFVRSVNAKLSGIIDTEIWPGPEADTREKLRQFVRDEAWGHHASCTNRMGRGSAEDDPKSFDPETVVDSRFRVLGTKNLRVIDASVFPDIPGFFIVAPTFMISEKASELIIDEYKSRDTD